MLSERNWAITRESGGSWGRTCATWSMPWESALDCLFTSLCSTPATSRWWMPFLPCSLEFRGPYQRQFDHSWGTPFFLTRKTTVQGSEFAKCTRFRRPKRSLACGILNAWTLSDPVKRRPTLPWVGFCPWAGSWMHSASHHATWNQTSIPLFK